MMNAGISDQSITVNGGNDSGDGDGGSGGAGGSGSGPGSSQSQLNCGTVLPDVSTIGSHVNSVVNSINNSTNADLANPVLEAQSGTNPLLVAMQTYSGTNFKLMYTGSANPAFLGNAGNFAYGAVAANMGVPLSAAELVAGVYAHLTHPSNEQVGPFGMDQSAKDYVPVGYNAQCKDQ